jgi:hypothetical protein
MFAQSFLQVVELAAAALKDGKTIAFYEPPAGPFYKVKSGDQSPWGHELIPLLRTAAASQSIDAGEYAAACHKYHVDGKDTIPYVNSALREAHAAIEAGKSWQDAATDDTQAHGMGKVSANICQFCQFFTAIFSEVQSSWSCKMLQSRQLVSFAFALLFCISAGTE